jgi:zinc D-Ala-D-Ala dipeptidase
MLSKEKNAILRLIIILNIIIVILVCIIGSIYIKRQRKNEAVIEKDVQIQVQELPSDFVDLRDYIPDITIDSPYATPTNVAEKRLYVYEYPYLRRGTAEKLKKANEEFMKMGYTIKVWDAYRPVDVQYILWDKVRDGRYIANPSKGSNHNRGAAVDITLIDSKGNELSMPTGFDGFSEQAHKTYKNVSKERVDNAKLLEDVMLKHGFKSIYTEWWHFDDVEYEKYDIIKDVIRLMAVKPLVLTESDNSTIKLDIIDFSIDIIVNVIDKININIDKLKKTIYDLAEKLSY